MQSTINKSFISCLHRNLFYRLNGKVFIGLKRKAGKILPHQTAIHFGFMCFDKAAWKNINAVQHIEDTYSYASTNAKALHNETVTRKENKKIFPAFYFFVVFLCCCIFLWIEKKLS